MGAKLTRKLTKRGAQNDTEPRPPVGSAAGSEEQPHPAVLTSSPLIETAVDNESLNGILSDLPSTDSSVSVDWSTVDDTFLSSEFKKGAPLSRSWRGTLSLAISKSSGKLVAVKSLVYSSAGQASAHAEEMAMKMMQIRQVEFQTQSILTYHSLQTCSGTDDSKGGGARSPREGPSGTSATAAVERPTKGITNRIDIYEEFVSGSNLAKLAPLKLEESVIRDFIRQVVLALMRLHDHGIAHGNVKGSNCLVSLQGQVKLSDCIEGPSVEISRGPRQTSEREREGAPGSGDFQLAGVRGARARENLSVERGDPHWLSPEVAAGLSADTPGDVWSLGCVVLELLSGRKPWTGLTSDATAVLKAIVERWEGGREESVHVGGTKAPPFPTIRISPECRRFLDACFRRDPTARPSCRGLLEEPWLRSLSDPLAEVAFITSPNQQGGLSHQPPTIPQNSSFVFDFTIPASNLRQRAWTDGKGDTARSGQLFSPISRPPSPNKPPFNPAPLNVRRKLSWNPIRLDLEDEDDEGDGEEGYCSDKREGSEDEKMKMMQNQRAHPPGWIGEQRASHDSFSGL
uniref:Protein kinase domain-containing protein n=1 Tax=Chromera velia CCMP2878 TaxID=1169474 RepID=A0A0G4HM82_9ALVE|eukprot:Cvel_1156.t1-p1 / transcript=Cvel_1156.t1 / gene=Cvel_1156 / organism=Chromera_velia_CCMP2878 / gene_product=Mitogen-activated protein kinase kinase kinase 2, putative / transcript_product=Mitogen-activated protein kinase kinase kinase 2, putative / location=Cvel_scaffold38:84231-88145(+) / protein_length=571 / sequence_SO=supercontig / SO=protein_coding / is_pseudo=false